MSTQLKFDGPRLDDLLARVGRELGPEAVILEANRTRRGGVGGFFAKEWFEVVVAGPSDLGDPAPPAVDPDDALLALADAVEDGASVEVLEPMQETVPRPSFEPDRSFAGVLARVSAPVVPVATPVAPVAAPVVPVATSPDPSLRGLALRELLAHLDRIVPRSSLPPAAAPVIAVVGDLSASRPVAAALAARLGMGDADVVVATADHREGVPPWLRIDSPAAARARADRWRRNEQTVVVAVDLTPGRDGHGWAADVLAALDADQVRLVARAWQVTDDLGPRATALGGVDGLELVDLDAAAEPEAFLGLDLAVLGLDGRPASSELWAALLIERRNDAAI